MNLTQSEAESYLDIFLTQIAEVNNVDVVLVPPFTAIPALGEALKASKKSQAVCLGAQNMHWEKCGAFTGEISATMLRPVGSDRRFEAKIGQDEREKMRAGWNQALGRSKAWSA